MREALPDKGLGNVRQKLTKATNVAPLLKEGLPVGEIELGVTQSRFGIGRYGLLNETQGVVKHATRL